MTENNKREITIIKSLSTRKLNKVMRDTAEFLDGKMTTERDKQYALAAVQFAIQRCNTR